MPYRQVKIRKNSGNFHLKENETKCKFRIHCNLYSFNNRNIAVKWKKLNAKLNNPYSLKRNKMKRNGNKMIICYIS